MKIFSIFWVAGALLFVPGCISKQSAARKLLETARFEEQQNNIRRARDLYMEILDKYPETQAADQVKHMEKTINYKPKGLLP